MTTEQAELTPLESLWTEERLQMDAELLSYGNFTVQSIYDFLKFRRDICVGDLITYAAKLQARVQELEAQLAEGVTADDTFYFDEHGKLQRSSNA